MFTIKEGTAPDKVGEGTPPEVLDSISKYLEKTGHVVRTTDQEKTFLEARTQAEVNKALGERYQQFENTILETTGIPKSQGEKFYEYHKRAVTEKLKDVNTLQDKLKEFETKGLQGSELAQQYKRDLEAARQQMATINADWENKYKQKDEEIFSTKVEGDIEKVLAKIRSKIDPTIKPELVEDIVAARLAKFQRENKPANLEGMLVFKNPTTGVTYTGKKDGKPEGTEERLLPYFADIISEQRQQGGAGSGQQGQGGNGQQPKWKEINLPAEIKTRLQLTEYLMQVAKLDPSTKDYSDAFEALKGTMPLK
jgi:ppGpp synthetase/RelA/SpoT-type nucleotidyltranferase